MRTIAIGDIHGGYKALKQLLDKIKLQPSDQLIFLGDYVDGWSESFEVINFLISLSLPLSRKRDNKEVHTEPVEVPVELQSEELPNTISLRSSTSEEKIFSTYRLKNKPIYLRGNHDELVLNYFEKGDHNDMWLFHGGKSTVKSYQNRKPEDIERHISFLKNDLYNYYEKDGRGYFHAGFHNLKGPEFEYYETMSYWDRSLWEMALALDDRIKKDDLRYPNRLKIYDEIYIGHTPTDRLGKHVPVNAANVWNIDTAAAYKGPLTAICVEDKTIWQSDPVHTFYPDENGRN